MSLATTILCLAFWPSWSSRPRHQCTSGCRGSTCPRSRHWPTFALVEIIFLAASLRSMRDGLPQTLPKVGQWWIKHDQVSNLLLGKGIQSLVLLVLLTLNVSELVCYIVIARDLFEQNKNMVGILTNKAITKRNKGSVITLSGQVMAFVIEVLISILTLVAVNVSNWSNNETA